MDREPPPTSPPLRPELPDGVTRATNLPVSGRGAAELPHWPFWIPLAALVMTLVITTIAVTAIGVLANLSGEELDLGGRPWPVIVAGGLIQQLAMIGSAVIFARVWAGSVSFADFGIRRTPVLPAIGWTVAVWLTFIVFSALYATVFDIKSTDELPERLGADQSVYAMVGVTFMAAFMAPIAEELFFRGFCFTALRRSIGLVGGIVGTGAIFGLVHIAGSDAEFLVPLGVFGALLCVLYWRTGSLIPCMVLHALNNSVAIGRSLEWQPLTIVATMLAASLAIIGIALWLTRRPAFSDPVSA